MSGTAGCPGCGAEVSFAVPGAVLSVCTHCQSVVAKRGLDYKNLGKSAQVADIPSSLVLGMRGQGLGGFQVVGRLQIDHGAGTWNEWYLALNSGEWQWLAESQGRMYLLSPVKGSTPPVVPRFTDLKLGHSLSLPGIDKAQVTYHTTEIHEGKVVAVQGQIPHELSLNAPLHYADLSGAGGRIATLDYADPKKAVADVYVGKQIKLETLRLEKGSVATAPRVSKAGKRMSCPSCQGALKLAAPDLSMHVTCPYCRALVDCSVEPLVALRTLAPIAKSHSPRFALGSVGTLQGKKYTVLGHMRRDIVKDEGGWDEYLLWTCEPDADSAFRYLIESGGHFTLVEPIAYGDIGGAQNVRYWNGLLFHHAESCRTRVSHVNGEFPWAVAVDEQTAVDDFAMQGMLLSIERSLGSHPELNASVGRYLDSAEVFSGFGLSGSPPKKEYVAPHQPNPYRPRWERQKKLWLWTTVLSFVLMGHACIKPAREVGRFTLTPQAGTEPTAEQVLISEPFAIGKKGDAVGVEVSLRSEVNNSWAGADISLINEETGDAHTVGLEVSYYHGYSDGESWSEGETRTSEKLPSLPGGQYVARIEPSWPLTGSCTTSGDCGGGYDFSCIAGQCQKDCIDEAATDTCGKGYQCVKSRCAIQPPELVVRVREPVSQWGLMFFLWLLISAVPGWNLLKMRAFETKRRDG